MENKTIGFPLRWICVIIFITAVVASLTTGIIIYNNSKIILGTTSIKDDDALREFLKVYNGLDENYYENIDKTKMIEEAIAAMLNYLGEDYSTYLDQNQTDDLENRLSGKFKGIGISITNGREIVKVYENTPAKKAGIEAHDIIMNINGKETENLTQAEVANLIDKIKENTIIVDRNGELLTFKVTAESINRPLTSEKIENTNIGYIYISAFTETVGEEFKKSLEELEENGIEKLIIDMRGNTGGYLKGATEIANMFIEKNKLIYILEGKDNKEEYRDETDEKREYPIAILMDGNTASASEVLAGALKDSYGVTLVGETSFGKGKVQQTKSLEDGSMVKYTTARWLRPNGECIDGYGLQPDVEVKLPIEEDKIVSDTQLEKAIELLS